MSPRVNSRDLRLTKGHVGFTPPIMKLILPLNSSLISLLLVIYNIYCIKSIQCDCNFDWRVNWIGLNRTGFDWTWSSPWLKNVTGSWHLPCGGASRIAERILEDPQKNLQGSSQVHQTIKRIWKASWKNPVRVQCQLDLFHIQIPLERSWRDFDGILQESSQTWEGIFKES